MAIRGSLEEASLADVVQLLALGRKTGCLTLAERSMEGAIYLQDGRVCAASVTNRHDRLGDILVKSGKITEEDLEDAIRHQQGGGAKRISQALVESGRIERSVLERFVRVQVEEAVYFMFTWRTGSFTFQSNVGPTGQEVLVSIDPESLLLEGARRVDEWSQIEKKIPSLDLIFRAEAARLQGAHVSLTEEQRRILPLLDGTHDVTAVVEATGMPEFDVGKALYGLITAGFVHLIERRTGIRHLDYRELLAYVVREAEFADPERRRAAARHIADCTTCAQRIKSIHIRRSSIATRTAEVTAAAAVPRAPTVAPDVIPPESPVESAEVTPERAAAAAATSRPSGAPPSERRRRERRSDADRRLVERRRGERRHAVSGPWPEGITTDRRSGLDRRQSERRSSERRLVALADGVGAAAVAVHPTPVTHRPVPPRTTGPRRLRQSDPNRPLRMVRDAAEEVARRISAPQPAPAPARKQQRRKRPAAPAAPPARPPELELEDVDRKEAPPRTREPTPPQPVARAPTKPPPDPDATVETTPVPANAAPPAAALAPEAPEQTVVLPAAAHRTPAPGAEAPAAAAEETAAQAPAEDAAPARPTPRAPLKTKDIEWLLSPDQALDLVRESWSGTPRAPRVTGTGEATTVPTPPRPASPPPAPRPAKPPPPHPAPAPARRAPRPAAVPPPATPRPEAEPEVAPLAATPRPPRSVPVRWLAVAATTVIVVGIGWVAFGRASSSPSATRDAVVAAAPSPDPPGGDPDAAPQRAGPPPVTVRDSVAPAPRPVARQPVTTVAAEPRTPAPAAARDSAPTPPPVERPAPRQEAAPVATPPPTEPLRPAPQPAAPAPTPAGASVRGVVRDAETGAPLAGVQVSIAGTGLTATTDAAGGYAFSSVPAGAVTVSAAAGGYAPGTRQVTAPAGASLDLDLALSGRAPAAREPDEDLAAGGWEPTDRAGASGQLGRGIAIIPGLWIESIAKPDAANRRRVRVAQLTPAGDRIVLIETRSGAPSPPGPPRVTALRIIPPTEAYPVTAGTASFGDLLVTAKTTLSADSLRTLLSQLIPIDDGGR